MYCTTFSSWHIFCVCHMLETSSTHSLAAEQDLMLCSYIGSFSGAFTRGRDSPDKVQRFSLIRRLSSVQCMSESSRWTVINLSPVLHSSAHLHTNTPQNSVCRQPIPLKQPRCSSREKLKLKTSQSDYKETESVPACIWSNCYSSSLWAILILFHIVFCNIFLHFHKFICCHTSSLGSVPSRQNTCFSSCSRG